jgi:hypothetical protein
MIETTFIERTARKVFKSLKLEEPKVIEDPLDVILLFSNLLIIHGGDLELARHWLRTYNKHLQYIPADRAKYKPEFEALNAYLESFIHH